MTDELLSWRFVPTSSHWYSRNYATRQDQYHSMSVRSLLRKTILALFDGLIFGGSYIQRGLSVKGNLRFKIDWASFIVGRKFTLFALFYFVFEGNFQLQARGVWYLEGLFNGGFFALRVWGLIFRGAYTRRGLFSEFYGMQLLLQVE